MPRPARAILDLSALRDNLAVARRAAGKASVLAVVKANAYGHGLMRVLPALEAADGLALIELEQAVALRERGYAKPLLLLGGFFEPEDVKIFVAHRLSAVLHHEDQLLMLEKAGIEGRIDVFLKFNTGMNRLGFAIRDAQPLVERLRRSGKVSSTTLMTHFANADDSRGVDWQLAAFRPAQSLPLSMANSAALLRHPATVGEWVRPGIMLYGSSPFSEQSAMELGLRPVMTLETRIIGVQRLERGDRVGYGGTFTAQRPMRIGVIACGYADGYPRHAPSGTAVTVDGERSATVGRVSMDLMCVDVTGIVGAGVGSRVQLWGREVSVDEVAAGAGTVSYELLCALSPRVPVIVQS
jgi:alanine racemase